MSTAAPAAGAAAPAATPGQAAPTDKKVETVPSDIRRRVLGMKPLPAPTPEEIAAKKKTEDDAAAAKAAAETAAAAAKGKTETPPPVEKVKKVKAGPPLPETRQPAAADTRSVEEVVRQVTSEITRENTPAAPALDPDIQREIDLAKFAESKQPEKYRGFSDKVKSFYTSREQMLADKAKELGGAKSPDFREWVEGDEFKGWLEQNRPSYQRGDKAKLQEEVITERARDDAKRELAPQLKQLERQTAELKYAPEIRMRTEGALKIIITDPNAEKDPALEGFAKDPAKFGEEHPDEARIIASEAAEAMELIEEVFRIDHDLVDFDPKKPTPKQAEIRTFMRGRNALLREKYPSGMEMKDDGKILIDADTYTERGLHKDPRYRVFSADEIVGMLAAERNAKVIERLQSRRVGVAKSVYAPRKEAPATPPLGQGTKPNEEAPVPGAGTRAAPGAAVKPSDKRSLARRYG